MGYYWILWLSSSAPQPFIPKILPPTGEQLSLRRGFNYVLTRPDP